MFVATDSKATRSARQFVVEFNKAAKARANAVGGTPMVYSDLTPSGLAQMYALEQARF